MKKIYLKSLMILFLTSLVTSCSQDELLDSSAIETEIDLESGFDEKTFPVEEDIYINSIISSNGQTVRCEQGSAPLYQVHAVTNHSVNYDRYVTIGLLRFSDDAPYYNEIFDGVTVKIPANSYISNRRAVLRGSYNELIGNLTTRTTVLNSLNENVSDQYLINETTTNIVNCVIQDYTGPSIRDAKEGASPDQDDHSYGGID